MGQASMVGRVLLLGLLLIGIVAAHPPIADALSSRNPFRVADVPNPDGPDVMQLAARVRMPGGPDDRNAAQWVDEITPGSADRLDGEWSSRWAAGTSGTAKIEVIGDRLYALFSNRTGRMAGKIWLLEAVIGADNRVAGRWQQIGNARDTGPFIGLVVSAERIDGIWSGRMSDRWDFRRRLPGAASD
jgi:hypothetical protein